MQTKKFVLYCNRCRHCSYTIFFNLNFVHVSEDDALVASLISKKVLCLNQVSFLLLTELEEVFQLSKIVQKIQKNLYLFKLVSKCKRVITKWRKRLQVFNFWDLKLVPTDSALNSASGNLTIFFLNYRCGTSKIICSANEWTCFYMVTVSVMKRLSPIKLISAQFSLYEHVHIFTNFTNFQQ